MKSSIRFLFLILALINGAIGFTAPPKSAEELRDRIQSALRANNTNAFFSLYNWNGVEEETIALQKEIVGNLFTKKFKGTVEISSKHIRPEEIQGLGGVIGDYRYFPNIQMEGQITVTPAAEKADTNSEEAVTFSGVSLFFGKTNAEYYLPGMLREKLSTTAPRPISLGISTSAWFPKSQCLLSGIYTYTDHNDLFTNSFTATNNLSLFFWGESIQTCQVMRDTNECPIELDITSNGKEIFKSGLISNTNIIRYILNH